MKIKIRSASVALAVWSAFDLTLATALAQGTAFTYQGRLNIAGDPANGWYDFRFKLYTDPYGNNQNGSSFLTNAVPVTNGLFITMIDFGAGIFIGSANWLEVDVRTNGAGGYTVLSPLQDLTPTPYAVYAETANAAGLSGTIPSATFGGTYGNIVTLNNAGNIFSGNGGGLANVNAVTLGGLGANQFWKTTGNSNTVAGANYLGTADNQPLELRAGGLRALRLEPDPRPGPEAANLIGGFTNNFIEQPGSGGDVIVGGGYDAGVNIIHSNSSGVFIGAGSANQVGPNVNDAVITGGYGNTIGTDGFRSFIGGGIGNTNNEYDSVIGGGQYNFIQIYADHAFIGGGQNNSIGGSASLPIYGAISGGYGNTIQTNVTYGFIGGGYGNTIVAGSQSATIAGGSQNTSSGSGATVGGGIGNTSIGGAGYEPTVAGGEANTANGYAATVGGGRYNFTFGEDATIAGGGFNFSTNFSATVGGGFANNNAGSAATIGGGSFNSVAGDNATVGGGEQNTVSAQYATVGGGIVNGSKGWSSTVPGGYANNANGDYSFAAGSTALAAHSGAFVWSDASDFLGFSSTTTNQFSVRALGGVRFVTGGAGMTVDGQFMASRAGGNIFSGSQTIVGADGAQLVLQNSSDNRSWYIYDESFNGSGALIFQPSGGPGNVGAYIRRSDGNYIVNSDARLKQDITPIVGILDRVLQLRPVSYHFRNAPEGSPLSLGLIAQEVEPLFPDIVGERNGVKNLAYAELIPVTIRAIQELNERIEQKNVEIQTLKQQNDLLVDRLNELEVTVKQLAAQK